MVILHGTYYNGPWVCVIKVCSNGGTTYIIGEIIAKDNLNIENFLQLQNYRILRYYTKKVLVYV